MGASAVRRAAVAGAWYPADRGELTREVDAYLSRVPAVAQPRPLAVVAPHAGLKYSGPIAAHAYKALLGCDVDVAVLVGPSHFVGFEGVAVYARGAFETPLGAAVIDENCALNILAATPLVREYRAAHAKEHSLEMQLPFLKRVLPEATIVPLVMGVQRRETVFALADALVAAVRGRRAVLIASSDLSHYQSALVAAELDGQVIERVERFDAVGLMDLLDAAPEHACGGGPTVSVMLAAKALGAVGARVLKYGDSGDVSGDKSSVVGYMAALFS